MWITDPKEVYTLVVCFIKAERELKKDLFSKEIHCLSQGYPPKGMEGLIGWITSLALLIHWT